MMGHGLNRLFDSRSFKIAITLLSVLCAAPSGCGGGGGGGTGVSGGAGNLDPGGFSVPARPPLVGLTAAEVTQIILQAQHEAGARGRPATVAVVDRVGNVLAVSQMGGAPATVTVTGQRGVVGGLEAASVGSPGAAISKAVTGAYLSSLGNAFTTRTASQIVQEHFNPGVTNQPGGPLFGVQFSQLPCGDFVNSFSGTTFAGPMRAPLGLSADPGGLPLYKSNTLVGGIGIVSKGTYTLDRNVFDFDVNDDDENIALAGQSGFQPPSQIEAENITVAGLSLRYTDATTANLAAPVAAVGTVSLVSVTGFYNAGGGVLAGQIYGAAVSGVRPDNGTIYPGLDLYVFDTGSGTMRFTPTAGLAPAAGFITAAEAQQLISSAMQVATTSRAQIRIPANSSVQVTVTIVDLDGNILAMARTPDAPIFGADVSVQKARSAVFFSRTDAAARISGITAATGSGAPSFADYINRSVILIGGGAFSNGIAFSERAIGNVARPFYPDGIDANGPGSLSLSFPNWSPFSDGLQLDLVKSDIVTNGAGGAAPPASGCARFSGNGLPLTASGNKTQLANGLQIFAGGVPIYRNTTLVGAIGVSGDGIDQDDMVSYLGVQNGPSTLNNAPANIRADTLTPGGVRLRYVNCPFAPFLNSGQQNPCP